MKIQGPERRWFYMYNVSEKGEFNRKGAKAQSKRVFENITLFRKKFRMV